MADATESDLEKAKQTLQRWPYKYIHIHTHSHTHTHQNCTQASIAKVVADAAESDLEKAKQAAAKMAAVNKNFLKVETTEGVAGKPTGSLRIEEVLVFMYTFVCVCVYIYIYTHT